MRKFKVSSELKRNIERILFRRCIPYRIEDDFVFADISGTQFHKIVVRARMELLEEQDFVEYLKTHLEPPVSYLAKSEVNDAKVKAEIGSVYVIK